MRVECVRARLRSPDIFIYKMVSRRGLNVVEGAMYRAGWGRERSREPLESIRLGLLGGLRGVRGGVGG